MALRKGKTKTLLLSSIDSALLAVEVYNKPRTSFRSEAYITLMIIAWTRLFHAFFNNTIGDRYYYKGRNKRRYIMVDGERKAWDLNECIKKCSQLSEAVTKNLEFFIKLRNKVEHRHINRREVDVLIFGECQALLFNFENQLINFFGPEYALNEALVYSLQFSHLRQRNQQMANKSALSKDVSDLVSYVEKYRSALSDDVFSSQEYSIKLLQVPKISNTNRADAAIEFVRWDLLSEEDRQAYDQIATIIKDKTVRVEAANVGRLKPSKVVEQVNNSLVERQISMNIHTALWQIFNIRPASGADDPFDTNTDFCHYDEPLGDYLYQESWVEFLVNLIQSERFTFEDILQMQRSGNKLDIKEYLP
jgi:hypothetical protein